jgi:thymidylate kinase
MTTHVAILGIDGSGKSTLTASLPALLAGELGCRAGSLGDHLLLAAPDHDLAGPDFEPDGVPVTLRLARAFRRLAKRATGRRHLYPPLKLAQLAGQAAAARRLARRHRLDVMVSDGSLVLSAAARACNYRATTSSGLVDRWDAGRLPDAVVLLDVSPAEALRRMRRRGGRLDRHENERDLGEARRGYLAALAAYLRRRPDGRALVLPADGMTPGEVALHVLDFLRRPLLGAAASASDRAGALHRSESVAGTRSALVRLLNPRYSFGHLVLHAPQGAWREPLFLLSAPGRQLLREGYSADVMRLIYDAGARRAGLAERAFLTYPLHRAVADRLEILAERLEAELEARLARGPVTVLTAPSGFAYDLFEPLEAIALRRPELASRVRLVAADLDPDGRLEVELGRRARRLGARLRFLRGDLTDGAFRERLAAEGPFDLALFVGLSAWLPKPAVLSHLRWLRGQLLSNGLLLADCFSPAPHAVSGHHMGYRATYFQAQAFAVLLDACGFAPGPPRSGRDGHNHVFAARPDRDRYLVLDQPSGSPFRGAVHSDGRAAVDVR